MQKINKSNSLLLLNHRNNPKLRFLKMLITNTPLNKANLKMRKSVKISRKCSTQMTPTMMTKLLCWSTKRLRNKDNKNKEGS